VPGHFTTKRLIVIEMFWNKFPKELNLFNLV
jgi:hypothetical protein